MSRPIKSISNDTVRFHQIVEQGNLEGLKAALENGADINAPGHVGMTALMHAIAKKDLAKTTLLIRHGADPELTDDLNRTALCHAVEDDFEDGVRFLLSLGVDRGYKPKYPLKPITYDVPLLDVPMPESLKQVMSESEWNTSIEETQESIRESGQNPKTQPLICQVQSVAVLQQFLRAGDDLNLAPEEMKRKLLGMETGGDLRCTLSDYKAHKSPQYAVRNPERMEIPFWREMIRTGVKAYAARQQFNDTGYGLPGAVWCYHRFGASLTPLQDGRFVQIGGEHEDHYDPDFHIYNDVVIHDGKGNFDIYGYPQDIFPPTDFHTATLCANSIYVVGCLGYMDQRQAGRTPVYRLTLDSWEIEAVATTGDAPGWIHGHNARCEVARNTIRIAGGEIHVAAEDGTLMIVPNKEQFELDISLLEWSRMK
jgi:hypothetical protein